MENNFLKSVVKIWFRKITKMLWFSRKQPIPRENKPFVCLITFFFVYMERNVDDLGVRNSVDYIHVSRARSVVCVTRSHVKEIS